MPSNAYGTFKYNVVNVERLAKAHEALAPTGQGKRGLGHITRSAIVILCACWEQYAEDVILEAVTHIGGGAGNPGDLPKQVRKVLGCKVQNAKNKLKPLELAGRGWQDVYTAYAKNDVGEMHSPKAENIQKLMKDYLGIGVKVYDAWTHGKDRLDEFVGLRNSIAHKGRAMGKYIKFHEVGTSIELVHLTVVETDNFIIDFLAEHLGQRPWNRRRV